MAGLLLTNRVRDEDEEGRGAEDRAGEEGGEPGGGPLLHRPHVPPHPHSEVNIQTFSHFPNLILSPSPLSFSFKIFVKTIFS